MTTPAVAFAIGRAIGNAVVRNGLRRRMRAILSDSTVPPGILLIGVRPGAAELTFDQLRHTLVRMIDSLPTRPR